jgi:hypothetical protein
MPNSRLVVALEHLPERLRRDRADRLVVAARVLSEELTRTLGVQGSPSVRSAPGEAPRRQSGHLQETTRAIADTNRLRLVIVTDAPYGPILNDQLNRPFARIAVDRSRAAVRAALQQRG